MTDFDALLDAALERKTNDSHTAEVTITVAEKPVRLRFTELDSRDWAKCTLSSPPREGVIVDALFGFDVSSAAELAAPLSGVAVDGDSETDFSLIQWGKLFKGISGRDRQQITDAVIAVNEDAQMKRMEDAKKLLEGESRRKRRSPAK